MELAAADVERADPGGAGLEEAVREPAGRGADIEAVLARDVDRERGERMGELLASAGDEAGRLCDLEPCLLVEQRAGLVLAPDASGEHEGLGLRPRHGQAALDEQHVQPLLHPWEA